MDVKLTELLCARICHDLAGPIGAISNGIEFLREDSESIHGQAFDLVESSANEMVARLKFFRTAYGVASSEGEADISHLRELTRNLFAEKKVLLDWPDHHTEAAGISITHLMGRLMLNLIIITSSSLIYGGTLSVRMEKRNGDKHIIVRGHGKKVKIDPNLDAILADTNTVPMDKRNIQMHYSAALAKELNTTLTINCNTDTLELDACTLCKKTESNQKKDSIAVTT